MENKKEIMINKNVFWLGIATFLGDISGGLVNVVLPLFLQNTLGLNKTFIGTVEGIADFTAGFLRIFSGWYSDKIGKRKVFVYSGYLIAGLSRTLLALASSGVGVLLLRFADRFGGGIRLAPADALIADQSHARHRGRSFGFNRAMDAFGAVIGPVLAFWILNVSDQDYRLVFWLTAIPAALTVAVVAFFIKDKEGSVSTELPKLTFAGLDSRFKTFVGIVVLFTLGNSSDAFLILRAETLGINPAIIPLWWATYNIVATLLSIPAGIVSDRIGRGPLIVFRIYLFCCRLRRIWFSTKL